MTQSHAPGNPELAELLRAGGESAAHQHANAVLARRGLPDEVLMALLDDMAVLTSRMGEWDEATVRRYGAARVMDERGAA